MTDVLVLGAGLVARPLVRYLLEDEKRSVTVASRTVEKAEALIQGHPKGASVAFDIEDGKGLKELVSGHSMVVSMLPYIHHASVARAAVDEGKDMVTTSYANPAIRALDAEARDRGVTLLNEMGLDPGIDHMEAMRVIDSIKAVGGKVDGFISYCGGLPAPEANTNPWGYKFSWSPRGVVLASRNSARFRMDGNTVEVPGRDLFANYELIDIEGLGTFEGYPNRDSVPYADIYGIGDAGTILRGTLRNRGWCDTLKAVHDIGLLEEAPPECRTYAGLLGSLVPGRGPLRARIAERIRTKDNDRALSNMEWLGLLSRKRLRDTSTRLDALCALLQEKLRYSRNERDMVILKHIFHATLPEGKRTFTSTLIDFGIPGGDSSMSRTVGLPAGIGAEMVLSGKLRHLPGVQIPVRKEIYGPALLKLSDKGIRFQHSS